MSRSGTSQAFATSTSVSRPVLSVLGPTSPSPSSTLSSPSGPRSDPAPGAPRSHPAPSEPQSNPSSTTQMTTPSDDYDLALGLALSSSLAQVASGVFKKTTTIVNRNQVCFAIVVVLALYLKPDVRKWVDSLRLDHCLRLYLCLLRFRSYKPARPPADRGVLGLLCDLFEHLQLANVEVDPSDLVKKVEGVVGQQQDAPLFWMKLSTRIVTELESNIPPPTGLLVLSRFKQDCPCRRPRCESRRLAKR